MKKILILNVFILATLFGAHAQINKVPANPNPIKYQQPDSTILTILLKGDENLHWAETSDGYTLLSNQNNGYEYAKLDKTENLVISGRLAHEPESRTKKENRF